MLDRQAGSFITTESCIISKTEAKPSEEINRSDQKKETSASPPSEIER